MTDCEKAEEFTRLLSHLPSVLTVCRSRDCSLARHVREKYPDMITFEWGLHLPQPIYDLKVDEKGVAGTLTFGVRCEFVFCPWNAIVSMCTQATCAVQRRAPSPIPPGWAVIKGGRQ